MSDALCYHVSFLMKPLGIPNDVIDGFVSREGRLLRSSPSTFVLKMKELHLILKGLVQGNPRVLDDGLSYWRVNKLPQKHSYTTYDNKVVYSEKVIIDPLISRIMDLPINHESLKAITGMMKLHTLAFIEKPTQAKREDIFKDISEPFTGDKSFINGLILPINTLVSELISGLSVPPNRYIPVWSTPGNPLKGSFCLDSRGVSSTAKRDQLLPYNLNYILRSKTIQDLYNEFPDEFISNAFTGSDVYESSFNIGDYPTLETEPPLGRVIAIPEPGNKFRVVNMPHLLLNSLSVNLGLKLKAINSSWAVQGVDSHTKCVSDIQARISYSLSARRRDSKVFKSIDIKAFTDRFPYKGFQSVILESLVNQGFISKYDKSVMDIICSADYEFLSNRERVKYSVGTPMGTYPSFPLASLANGIILYHAACVAKSRLIHKEQVPGRIIGDDVVIWDEDTSDLYSEYIRNLGVEISTSKCMSSHYCAEMCSKVIHPLGVFEQKKLKPIDSISSFVSNYSYYGDALADLSASSAEVLALCHLIPKPYGLGREVSSLINSEEDMTSLEIVYKTLAQANDLSGILPKQTFNKSDLSVMYQRYLLLPNLKIGSYVKRDFSRNLLRPRQEMILDIFQENFKLFMKERDKSKKLELSRQLNIVYRDLLELIPRSLIDSEALVLSESSLAISTPAQVESFIDTLEDFIPQYERDI